MKSINVNIATFYVEVRKLIGVPAEWIIIINVLSIVEAV
jgi:hypothetical protein